MLELWGGISMIFTLHLGLSYICNMRCKHCFVDKTKDRLSSSQCKKIIDDLYDIGLMVVIYTFGEPLLAKNFEEISNYISSKKISQVLMTNGYFLNEKNVEMLKKNKVNSVYVSLDSINPEEHDTNRGCPGAYSKAINGIKLLLEKNINVGLAITITKNNHQQMNGFLKLAQELGVKNISFLRERTDGKIIDFDDDLYVNFFEKNINNQEVNLEYHDPHLIPIINKLYNQGIISENVRDKYLSMNSCYVGHNLCIAPNGDVTKCNIAKKIVGNVNDDNIIEIVKRSKEYENFICCSKFSKEN